MDYNTEFTNRFLKKQATLISELISGKLSAEVHLELTQEIHQELHARHEALVKEKDAAEPTVPTEDDLHPRNPPKKK